MKVNLVSITKSLLPQKELTAEELIVYIARVSNPSNQFNTDTGENLIKYLVKNRHWSPFEFVNMTVEITTGMAIGEQILRHRSFSFQKFSQRYSEAVEVETFKLRKQADKNRQSSTEEFDPLINVLEVGNNGKITTVKDKASHEVKIMLQASMDLYKKLIAAGVAKECARGILPMSTQTTMYMNGTIRSWIHYLEVRIDEHVQLEHREVAEAIREIFIQNFPIISKALEWETQL